jgi:hypothetical protein
LPSKSKGQRKPQSAQTVRPSSLPDPASSPHPVAGTIEFEHGQIVAKLGNCRRRSERIISPELGFVSLSGVAGVTPTKSMRPVSNGFAFGVRAATTLAKLLVLPI